jgi:hypothetical protein
VRVLAVSSLLAIALGTACSSDEEPDDDDGAAPTAAEAACAAVADWMTRCSPASPCDDALLSDCAGFAAIVSDEYLAALTQCVQSGQPPSSCLGSSLGALQPSQPHLDLASQFCAECALGVAGCEQLFFGAGTGESESDERLGLVLLPFGNTVVDQVRNECTQGLTCAGTFLSCAQGVIAEQAIPQQSLQCFVDQALGNGEPPRDVQCDGASSGVGGAGATTSTGVGGASSTTTSSSGVGGGTGSCSHDFCVIGDALMTACAPCATTVCTEDPYCCSSAWDDKCVVEAKQLCGVDCGGGSTSTTTSSSSSGTSCMDGAAYEPNESEGFAESVAMDISDCDSDGNSITGVIAGDGDVDWFSYSANDQFGCSVDPTRSFSSSGMLRVCQFFECKSGTAEVSCGSGSTPSDSPDGRPGCCATQTFSAGINCTGTASDDTTVYLRVDEPGGGAAVCSSYTVDYHY